MTVRHMNIFIKAQVVSPKYTVSRLIALQKTHCSCCLHVHPQFRQIMLSMVIGSAIIHI